MKNKEKKINAACGHFFSCKFCPSHHWSDRKIHIFLVFPLRVALFTRRAGTSARAIWQIHQIRFLVTRLLCWTLVFRGQASLFRLSPTGLLTDVDKQKCNTSASHSSPQQKGGRRTDGLTRRQWERWRGEKKKNGSAAASPLTHQLKQCSVFRRPFEGRYGIGGHEHAVLALFAQPLTG